MTPIDRLAGLNHPADTCDPTIAPLVAELAAIDPTTTVELTVTR